MSGRHRQAAVWALLLFCPFLRSIAHSETGSGSSGPPPDAVRQQKGTALAERLLRFGDGDGSAMEYRRILSLVAAKPEACPALVGLARAQLVRGEIGFAERAWRGVELAASNPTDREEAALNRAILKIAQGAHADAQLTLLELEARTADSTRRCRAAYFAGHCAVEQNSWEEARTLFSRSLGCQSCGMVSTKVTLLDSLLFGASLRSFRSPATARRLSTFLPGAGQVYAGDPLNGLNALGVNGLAAWLAIRSARTREWDEVGLNLMFLLGRYYLGNRYQAAARTERYNQEQAADLRQRAARLAREAAGVDFAGP